MHGVHLSEPQIKPDVLSTESLEDSWQFREHHRRSEANRNASHLPGRDLLYPLTPLSTSASTRRAVSTITSPAGVSATRGRRLNSRAPTEDSIRRNQYAEVRLSHSKPLCGAAKMKRFREYNDRSELGKRHFHTIICKMPYRI